jgi:hypothetical protein
MYLPKQHGKEHTAMNTTPKISLEEENTQRLIGRANTLGYIIVLIDIEADNLSIEILPSSLAPYTPPLYRDRKTGEWTIQTTAYGSLNVDEIKKVAEGYGRAAAMVGELQHLTAGDLVNYSARR